MGCQTFKIHLGWWFSGVKCGKLSLGVNLLGHNGNKKTKGRMKGQKATKVNPIGCLVRAGVFETDRRVWTALDEGSNRHAAVTGDAKRGDPGDARFFCGPYAVLEGNGVHMSSIASIASKAFTTWLSLSLERPHRTYSNEVPRLAPVVRDSP